MADVELDVGLNSSGEEDQFAARLGAAIERAMSKAGREISRELSSMFKNVGRDFGRNFQSAARDMSRTTEAIARMKKQLLAIESTSKGVKSSFSTAFNPQVLSSLEQNMEQIAILQKELAKGAAAYDKEDLANIRQALVATGQAASSANLLVSQSAQAVREAEVNAARAASAASREKVASINADRSRLVVETQRASAQELATIRATSAQEVAATQQATRTRVEAFRFATQAIRSLERGLRTVFDGTSRAVSAAFRGISNVATTTASGISRVFRRSSSDASTTISSTYSKTFRGATKTVQDETRKQGTAISRFAQSATSSLGTIGVAGLGVIGAIGAVVAKTVTGGLKRAEQLEDSTRALNFLLDDTEKAADLQKQILDVVRGTPFKFDQFSNAATKLIAFNVQAEKVPGYLAAIGDAAALRGGDTTQTIDTLIRVYGQVSAASRIMGDDIRSLSDAGVPALQILGNAFGKSAADMRDMISTGAVPAEKALDVLTEGIENGSDGVNGATKAFKGLGKELGGTLKGSLANFSIAFDRLGANIIGKFSPYVVKGLGSATTAVDLLGDALGAFADSVIASPAFRLLTTAFKGLASGIDGAQDSIKPFLPAISNAAVAVGQLVTGLLAIRRVPAAISLLSFALRRVFTPLNLLILAGTGAVAVIQSMMSDSPELSKAISDLGGTIKTLFVPLVSVAQAGLATLSRIVTRVAVPALRALGGIVEEYVTPAVEGLQNFLATRVAPAIGRFAARVAGVTGSILAGFARVIRDDIMPALATARDFIADKAIPTIGRFLARAATVGRDALADLATFVTDKVIPAVGPILEKGVEVGRRAFRSLYDFMSKKFVPFVKSDLVPVLAGLAGAVAALAVGGSLPFAGLIGGAGLLAAALRDNKIREAIVDGVQGGVDKAREILGNIIDARTLTRVGVGAAKLARRLGRTIGDILTDPRVLGAAAAFVAAGVALAASFIEGLVEGIVGNIEPITEALLGLLTDGLKAALSAVVKDPTVGIAIAGILTAGAVVRKLVTASRATGKLIAVSMAQGATDAGAAQSVFGRSGSRNFVTGLIGGPAGLERAAAKAGARYASSMATAIGKNNDLVKALSGRAAPGLTQSRSGGRSGPTEATIDNYRKTERALDGYRSSLGAAGVAGARFNLGLQQIAGSIKGFVSGRQGSLAQLKSGLGQVGTALREGGRAAAVTAGAALGGAFMTSFVAQALFDAKASAGEKLQSGIGTAVAALGVASVTRPGVAAAAVGVGLVAAAIQESGKRAERARARVEQYTKALRDAGDEANGATDAIRGVFASNLEGASLGVLETFRKINFNYDQFQQAVATEGPNKAFADLSYRLRDANLGTENMVEAMAFLKTQADAVGEATARTQIFAGFEDPSPIRRAGEALGEAVKQAKLASDAAQAYKDKLQELNDQRIDALKQRVDDSKNALDDARDAADKARAAVVNFLTGNTEELSLKQTTDDAILNIANLGRSIQDTLKNSANVGGTELQAQLDSSAQAAADSAGKVLAQGLKDGTIIDKTSAAAALQPLIDAAQEQGTYGGNKAAEAIQKVIDNFTPEGEGLLTKAIDADGAVKKAQAILTQSENTLHANIELDPASIKNLNDQALQAGRDVDAGFGKGLDPPTAGVEAVATAANAYAERLMAALGINSPSTVFAEQGMFADMGFAQGITGGTGIVLGAVTRLALAARRVISDPSLRDSFYSAGANISSGLARGIAANASSVQSAARNVANSAAATMRSALQIQSPSKVTETIGKNISQGVAVGIINGRPAVNKSIIYVANTLISNMTKAGAAAVKAIGTGIAENGISFASSIGSAMDDAYSEALSRADKFKLIGKTITGNLFQNQGVGPLGNFAGFGRGGGGAADTQLRLTQLAAIGTADAFREFARGQRDKYGGFAVNTRQDNAIGRSNQEAFLQAGQKIRDYTQALIESGAPLDKVISETKRYRDQLALAANQASFNKYNPGVVERLLDNLGLSNEQLAKFVANVQATTKAAEAATRAEQERVKAENAAQRAQEAAEKKQKAAEDAKRKQDELDRQAAQDAQDAKDAKRPPTYLPPPTFRDLIVQTPTGDPEATALAVANRVAFGVRR